MEKMRFLIIVLFSICLVLAKYYTYKGYKVYRLVPLNEVQLQYIMAYKKNSNFDFWSTSRAPGHAIDVMVSPSAQNSFHDKLQKKYIPHVVLIANISTHVKRERKQQIVAGRLRSPDINFGKYNRYAEIMSYLHTLAVKYPKIVTVDTIGTSYEGRDLKIMKISTDSKAKKPVIFIEAGIHGREWVAHALALYIINQLVENTENAKMLEKVHWHILPVVNPDGYEYTHTKRRFWRKTRSRGQHCYGVDINRNFNLHWAEDNGDVEECTNTYRGPKPFSEPESQALRDHILNHKDSIKLYLSIHSYGGYVLYPWSFSHALPEDDETLKSLAYRVRGAISHVSGTPFWVGTTYNILYFASGTTTDWAKGVAGVNLTYMVELRAGGWFGFNPPPTSILSIVREAWAGVKEFHKHVETKITMSHDKVAGPKYEATVG